MQTTGDSEGVKGKLQACRQDTGGRPLTLAPGSMMVSVAKPFEKEALSFGLGNSFQQADIKLHLRGSCVIPQHQKCPDDLGHYRNHSCPAGGLGYEH